MNRLTKEEWYNPRRIKAVKVHKFVNRYVLVEIHTDDSIIDIFERWYVRGDKSHNIDIEEHAYDYAKKVTIKIRDGLDIYDPAEVALRHKQTEEDKRKAVDAERK